MKTALITGANKGIGFEAAKQLLQNDYYVFLGSRNEKLGNDAVEKLKSEGLSWQIPNNLELLYLPKNIISGCKPSIRIFIFKPLNPYS